MPTRQARPRTISWKRSAIVRVLAREGCRVAFSYKTHSEPAEELQRTLTAAGADVRCWPLDVLDGVAAAKLAQTIENEMGPVDVLINNAGFAQVLPFAMIEEADWDQMLDVNVKGLFLVTKAFARGLIRRKRGSIVNVGSLAGVRMLDPLCRSSRPAGLVFRDPSTGAEIQKSRI